MPNSPPNYQVTDPPLGATPDPAPVRVLVSEGPVFSRDETPPLPLPTYLAFGATTVYSWDYGLRAGDLAKKKGEDATAVWRLHGGSGTKTITWIAMSVDVEPVLPSADTLNPNEVLMFKDIGLILPCNAPDGQRCIGAWGIYRYRLLKMPQDSDRLMMGRSPFDVRAEQTIMPALFSQYIFGPSPPVAGAPSGYGLSTGGGNF